MKLPKSEYPLKPLEIMKCKHFIISLEPKVEREVTIVPLEMTEEYSERQGSQQ